MTGERLEIKLACHAFDEPRVMAALNLHHLALRTLHPTRRVQSIYFDTHEGRALQDNLAGIAERRKVRLRWYGEVTHGVAAVLELKARSSQLGTKDLLPLAEPIDVAGTRLAFMRTLQRHATPEWRERLAGREPAQWISYERDYLATPDRRLRVTVDRDLRTWDLRSTWRIAQAGVPHRPRLVVVECKVAPADRALVESLVQVLPMPVDKCSKFVLASAPAHGPIVAT